MKKHPINPSVLAIALSHAILQDVVKGRMREEDEQRKAVAVTGLAAVQAPTVVEAALNAPVVDAGDLDQG